MTTLERLGELGQRQHARMLAHGVGGLEPFRVLMRGEVDALEQLGRQDHLRALARGLARQALDLGDIGLHVVAERRLNGRDRDDAFRHHAGSSRVMQWNDPPPAMPEPSSARDGRPTTLRPGNTACNASTACVGRRRAVDRHGDHAVGDDEVDMRGGHRFAQIVHHQAGARNADHFELAPRRVGRGFERARDLLQSLGIGVVGAGRRLADHAAGPDEAGDGIDMAVGMVVQEAVVEPDDLARAERLAQRRFGLRFGPAVAIVIEQGLAGGEDRAVAVMLDGAAFQHEIEFDGPACRRAARCRRRPWRRRAGRTCRPSHWS